MDCEKTIADKLVTTTMSDAGPEKTKKQPKKKQAAPAAAAPAADPKNILGITVKKNDNFAQWYTEVLTKAELIEYYDVSGCYILRPWIYYVWETMQETLNKTFKANKVRNCYFPMFVTKGKLEAEESHVEGFSAEVAWVTKSGSSDLAEPIAIRPTSETIMYPAFQKWIRSHRDLPLKLNQWCPVVRWEFSHPTPFIRTREFLWQEGHTAHADIEEADRFARKMLDAYRDVYRDVMAIPVIQGQKSELEKFAGGFKTYTVEAYVECNGRSIQAGTSHNLGHNFAKIFDVQFEDDNREKHHVAQTSFGLSTRSIGTMILIHSDDRGLVLPPRCAPIQAVIIPIIKKGIDADALIKVCRDLAKQLEDAGVLVECDDRECYNPGWKYNHWELKGVPLRLEVGPRDVEQKTFRVARRFDGHKEDFGMAEAVSVVEAQLELIQKEMYEKARNARDAHIQNVTKFEEVMPALAEKKLILAPWCCESECEETVKKETARLSQLADTTLSGSMKTLCMPFEQPELPSGTVCFHCQKPAKIHCLWGRSY